LSFDAFTSLSEGYRVEVFSCGVQILDEWLTLMLLMSLQRKPLAASP